MIGQETTTAQDSTERDSTVQYKIGEDRIPPQLRMLRGPKHWVALLTLYKCIA